ncbi:MAG: sulfatase-like hydrolase/transferase, partial [Pseudomonadota bacterium]
MSRCKVLQSKRPKKIIWIVIDTLRADHLGCYGYSRDTSPSIDALARESMLFKWSFSTCSYTMPSHASMFTGKYPPRHSTGFSNGPPVRPTDNDMFLAEILSSSNYKTAAFVSAMVFGHERGVGIRQGFEIYDDRMTRSELNRPHELIRLGEETNHEIFEWLSANWCEDFFLFVNYFDVHGPYLNPKPYDGLFVDDEFYGEPQYIERVVPESRPLAGIPRYQVLKPVRNGRNECLNYEKDLRYYRAQYDGGIRYVDDRVRDLIDELKRLGIYDDSLIVFTSDHGEALGENGVYFFHGLTVTPEQIHVPLLIKPHRDWSVSSGVIDTHVSSVDIVPTILDLINVAHGELGLDGTSLIELVEKGKDQGLEKRVARAEIEGQIAYIDEGLVTTEPRHVDRRTGLLYTHVAELCEKKCSYEYSNRGFMREKVDCCSPEVSIVIVTYNSMQDIERCLESVYRNTDVPFEVIVVDNASTDGTQAYLKKATLPITILDQVNLGFSKACNRGIREAEGNYVVLLNPDTIVT